MSNKYQYLKNKKIIKNFEREKFEYSDYSEENQDLVFCLELLLSNPEYEFNINEDNIIKNDFCDVIWTNINEELNISFIKFLKKELICDEDNIVNNILKCEEFLKDNANLVSNIENYLGISNLKTENKVKKIFYFINLSKEIKLKNNVIESVKNDMRLNLDYEIKIINQENFSTLYLENKEPNIYVPEGNLQISNNKNNILEFKNTFDDTLIDSSFVCNISSKSLKDLYKKYENQLFNLNLRYFKKNKKIDEGIKKSIQNPEYFWYFNNGLVILCDSVEIINHDRLKIKNFSIINGGQTTFNISNTDFEKDFYLLCKIICIKDWISNEKNSKSFNLANDIAIFSNKQKPINNKDLISNMPILNEIKQNCLKNIDNFKYKLYIQTKTGEVIDFSIFDKKTEIANLEKILQLYWCWEETRPSLAKSQKAKMYDSEEKLTNALEHIKENYYLYTELNFLSHILKEVSKKASKLKELKGTNILQILKYFDFYNISFFKILFFEKWYQNKYNKSILSDFKDINSLIDTIKSSNFKINKIFNDNLNKDDILKLIIDLFINSESYDKDTKICFEMSLNLVMEKYEYSNAQIHNIPKNDTALFLYISSMIRAFNTNMYLKDKINAIFKFI